MFKIINLSISCPINDGNGGVVASYKMEVITLNVGRTKFMSNIGSAK